MRLLQSRPARFGLVAIALGLVAAGCGVSVRTGSGVIVTRNITDPGEFTLVETDSSFAVTIAKGEQRNVDVRADDNIIDDVVVRVAGDTLEIELKSGVRPSGAKLEADVITPALEGLAANGAGEIVVGDEFASTRFDVTAGGSSEVAARVMAQAGSAEASGASTVTLAGKIDTLSADGSGASDLDLADLEVDDLGIDLSGASKADVRVTGTLSASASGASDLRYAGDPKIEKSDTSGDSSIRPG